MCLKHVYICEYQTLFIVASDVFLSNVTNQRFIEIFLVISFGYGLEHITLLFLVDN